MTKKTNNGVDKTLRRLSLDRETPKSAFILILLLYGIATFLTRSSSNTQAEITLFGETMRFSALTGVFSMLGSTCIIVLVMLFRKVGYFTAMFLLIVQLLFSGFLFELKGASETIANITISKWSVESLCRIANIGNISGDFVDRIKDDVSDFDWNASAVLADWWIMGLMSLLCIVISIIVLRNVAKDGR